MWAKGYVIGDRDHPLGGLVWFFCCAFDCVGRRRRRSGWMDLGF